jgi:hypothetical protein
MELKVNKKKSAKVVFIVQTYKCLPLQHARIDLEIYWQMVPSFVGRWAASSGQYKRQIALRRP